ncbi:hypothetical protein V5F40_11295 [Xanthobacter sp. DSM 14520]|uniref:hypothetical protein n=1 Tax=Xanthobacter autotrophicus (strain ATCC BAA-1158 / Py2) TaxID=78245 RepID=UPI00372A5D0D
MEIQKGITANTIVMPWLVARIQAELLGTIGENHSNPRHVDGRDSPAMTAVKCLRGLRALIRLNFQTVSKDTPADMVRRRVHATAVETRKSFFKLST